MEIIILVDDSDDDTATNAPTTIQLPIDYTGNRVPHLNEDCLCEIFRKLTARDLFTVMQCSQQFKHLSQTMFKRRVGDNKIIIKQYSPQFIRKYGAQMKALTFALAADADGTGQLMEIDRHCPTLTNLTIFNKFPLVLFHQPMVGQLFTRLTELDIVILQPPHSNYDHFNDAVKCLRNLQKLKLGGYFTKPFLLVKYVQLRELNIQVSHADYWTEIFDEFCRDNQHIECLTIHCPYNNIDVSPIRRLQNLRVLTLQTRMPGSMREMRSVVSELGELPQLRTVKLIGTFMRLPSFRGLQQVTAIEICGGDNNVMSHQFNNTELNNIADDTNIVEFKFTVQTRTFVNCIGLIAFVEHCKCLKKLSVSGLYDDPRMLRGVCKIKGIETNISRRSY